MAERQTGALFGSIEDLQREMQDAVGMNAATPEELLDAVQRRGGGEESADADAGLRVAASPWCSKPWRSARFCANPKLTSTVTTPNC